MNRGATVPPHNPLNLAFDASRKFWNAYGGGGSPVTTNDLTMMAAGEPPILAVQGVREMINSLLGKPKQDPGQLVPVDRYNPLLPNGGT